MRACGRAATAVLPTNACCCKRGCRQQAKRPVKRRRPALERQRSSAAPAAAHLVPQQQRGADQEGAEAGGQGARGVDAAPVREDRGRDSRIAAAHMPAGSMGRQRADTPQPVRHFLKRPPGPQAKPRSSQSNSATLVLPEQMPLSSQPLPPTCARCRAHAPSAPAPRCGPGGRRRRWGRPGGTFPPASAHTRGREEGARACRQQRLGRGAAAQKTCSTPAVGHPSSFR
jgi:hypothetical protein